MTKRCQFCFNFAFKFNLRRYTKARALQKALHLRAAGAYTRPLFSST